MKRFKKEPKKSYFDRIPHNLIVTGAVTTILASTYFAFKTIGSNERLSRMIPSEFISTGQTWAFSKGIEEGVKGVSRGIHSNPITATSLGLTSLATTKLFTKSLSNAKRCSSTSF